MPTRSRTVDRRARPARVALAATVAVAAVAAAVPGARSPLIGVSAWAAVVLVTAGILRFRPAVVRPWWAVALMLALWAVGTTVVQVQGRTSGVVDVAVGLGQAVAVLITVALLRTSGRAAPERRGASMDLLVIVTVLTLVVLQLVSVAMSSTGRRDIATVAVPTVDIAVIGLLLRVVVTFARLQAAVVLGLVGALATVVYDLLAAVGGNRLALPGSGDQVLGILCVLLLGVAATHPTMVAVFAGSAFVGRRASAALLGLMPLVVVPFALWALARATRTAGLPTPLLLLGGCVVAGLCLLRGALVLHHSESVAEHDPVTGLLNRRGLSRVFTVDQPAGGWGVLLVEVRDFRQVRDTHGHDVSDALLLAIRDRLVAVTGSAAVLARLRGDEFMVLVPAAGTDAAAEAVVRALRRPVTVGGQDFAAEASVGTARTGGRTALLEILTEVDVAVSAARAAGANTVAAFRSDMRAALVRRFALAGQLRQLLDPDPDPDPGAGTGAVGRLELHYQPLVDLRTGAAVGAEALVRWRHPEHGLLPPGEFLPLVNLGGLDGRLDAVVLETAVADLGRWRAEQRPLLPISVNVTLTSLLDPTLGDRVLAALAAADLEPHVMNIEITEWEQLPDSDAVAANVDRLTAGGVGLHLDDYGAGYTSLEYLLRFPITTLKLDRSIVVSVTDDHVHLVAAIAAMAATLGIDLLAEGIETPEQQARLVALGVRHGQGWLFAASMDAAEFARRHLGGAGAAADLRGGHLVSARGPGPAGR